MNHELSSMKHGGARKVKGIVAAPQPVAAEVGASVMEAGGNAFDAAVAAGFVQMVADPFMCGLGGWGSATIYEAKTGKFEHIGFWARIGSKMRPDMWVDERVSDSLCIGWVGKDLPLVDFQTSFRARRSS